MRTPGAVLSVIVGMCGFLVACAGPSYWSLLDITLAGVQRPPEAEQRFGEVQLHTLETDDQTTYTMSDGLVRATVVPAYNRIDLTMENLSTDSIRILWDQGALVDIDRQSRRIVHGGVKYLEIQDAQTPSVVVGGSLFSDAIVPVNNIEYLPTLATWITHSLLPVTETKVKGEEGLIAVREASKAYLSRPVRLLLPLEVGGRRFEYVFEFRVNSFDVWRKRTRETDAGTFVTAREVVETVTE
ncbi:MAG: hypothetical protein HN396_15280 [Gemmatimonadales bacterium]|jgi:hypothetical protein|nr:hypothetical protein [Gemmatimonadales bacterium]MBT7693786.1 hypothetical protein [Gemmatimonadales bacterium]